MQCKWSNTCGRTNWCCHFCDNKGCDVRCKDDHKTCEYLVNAPLSETDANGETHFFKFVEKKDGSLRRSYLTAADLNNCNTGG